jgi:hypothetical protein
VILTRFGAESQVGARECGPQLGYQFLGRIGVIPESLPQLAITPGRGCGPMGVFMGKRGIVGHAFPECLEWRHLNVICGRRIEGLVPTVSHKKASLAAAKKRTEERLKRQRVKKAKK